MNNEENKLDKKILLSDEDLKSITGGTYSGLEEFCRMSVDNNLKIYHHNH